MLMLRSERCRHTLPCTASTPHAPRCISEVFYYGRVLVELAWRIVRQWFTERREVRCIFLGGCLSQHVGSRQCKYRTIWRIFMKPSLVILSSPIDNLIGVALKYHHLEITPFRICSNSDTILRIFLINSQPLGLIDITDDKSATISLDCRLRELF